MNDFGKYYNEKFRDDLNRFFETIPENSKHHDNYDKATYHIQYERLTNDHPHLNFMSGSEDKINFGIALFLSILVDEVCYTHFKPFYQEFKKLTNYPKFIGNCPSGCNYHLHPTDIFSAMNYSRKSVDGKIENRLSFYDQFIQALPFMEREVKDFFKKYLKSIDENDFWQKCYNELPYKELKKTL